MEEVGAGMLAAPNAAWRAAVAPATMSSSASDLGYLAALPAAGGNGSR